MKKVKARKPRGIKQNGRESEDLCPYCYSYNCDPTSMSKAFSDKITKRIKNGQCPSCGKPKAFCICKSSRDLHGNDARYITHNNRKERKVGNS